MSNDKTSPSKGSGESKTSGEDTAKGEAPTKANGSAVPKAAAKPAQKTTTKAAKQSDAPAASKPAEDKAQADKPADTSAGAATGTNGASKPAEAKDEAKAAAPTQAKSEPPKDTGKSAPKSAAAGSKQEAPKAAPSQPSRPSSTASSLSLIPLALAAIFGGVVAVVLQSLFLQTGTAPGGGTDPALTGRIETLESRIESLAAASGDAQAVETIRSDIASLRQRIETLSEAPSAEAVTQLRTQVQTLQDRVAGLEAEGTGPAGEGIDAARLSSIEGSLKDFTDALAAMETRLSQFQGETARAEARLTGRVEALESTTPANLPEILEGKADTASLQDLSGRVTELEKNEVAIEANRAATALVLANLSRASATSQPFEAELDAVAALGVSDSLIAPLRPYAAEGLPSVPVLRDRFSGVARDVIRADRAAGPDAGFVERFWAGVTSLMTIRPIGAVEGEGVSATVARAQDALRGGDLQTAVTEMSTIEAQGPVAEAMGDWLSAARARLELERLIDQLNTRVVQGMPRQG